MTDLCDRSPVLQVPAVLCTQAPVCELLPDASKTLCSYPPGRCKPAPVQYRCKRPDGTLYDWFDERASR